MLTTSPNGKIRILPEDVVNRIAAGEVVERPAAVVKELIDNSVDAHSKTITVDIKDGGLASIRVTDDGEGMSRADAPLAFERHATSKIRTDQDLWSIRSMGFRGEALPSIASVSAVRLVTATAHDGVGTEVHLCRGVVEQVLDAAPIVGTRIDVTGLFQNQPARKKFLKSVPTEAAHITRVVQQAALAWPAVHFKLIGNGQDLVNYPAVGTDQDRIGQVYPRFVRDHPVLVEAGQPGARLSGLIVDPNHAKGARTPQEVFVNRRPVRSAAVSHAIAEGYGSFLPKGQQPLYVLFLDIDPDRVDVNVHPSKREVRFAEQEAIHQLVRRAVRQALGQSAEVSGETLVPQARGASIAPAGLSRAWFPDRPSSTLGKSRYAIPPIVQGLPVQVDQLAFVNEAAEPYTRVSSAEVRALGQLHRTYLVVQVGGALTILDQHTAHERVLFERLYRAWVARGMASQALLIPESIELSAPHAALLQRYQEELEQLGLEIEPFGLSTVLVRSVPSGVGAINAAAFLPDLLEDLSLWGQASGLEERVRPVLASLACHSAVRAGRLMGLPEIQQLAEDWLTEGTIQTCPHGRRTVYQLAEADLEKLFGRVGW